MAEEKADKSAQTEDIRDRTTKTSWMLSNWLLIIIVTLLVASLAYLAGWRARGIVNVKPNPSPQVLSSPTSLVAQASPAVDTAKWKTYTNKTFNYSIKLPQDWNIGTSSQDLDYIVAINPPHTSEETDWFYIYGSMNEKSQNLIAHDLIWQNIIINGTSGTTAKTKKDNELDSYYLFTNSKHQTIEIDHFKKYPNNIYSQAFDQILSTFRFVNSELNIITVAKKITDNVTNKNASPVDFVIDAPKNSVVAYPYVTWNNSKFQFIRNDIEEHGNSEDTYSDEPFPNADILRAWRNNNGVFKLNPQGLTIGGYYLDHISLVKISPSETLTTTEVNQWKELLKTLRVVSVEN